MQQVDPATAILFVYLVVGGAGRVGGASLLRQSAAESGVWVPYTLDFGGFPEVVRCESCDRRVDGADRDCGRGSCYLGRPIGLWRATGCGSPILSYLPLGWER